MKSALLRSFLRSLGIGLTEHGTSNYSARQLTVGSKCPIEFHRDTLTAVDLKLSQISFHSPAQ